MIVICNTSLGTEYIAKSEKDCRSLTDRSAFRSAIYFDDLVRFGVMVAYPIRFKEKIMQVLNSILLEGVVQEKTQDDKGFIIVNRHYDKGEIIVTPIACKANNQHIERIFRDLPLNQRIRVNGRIAFNKSLYISVAHIEVIGGRNES